MACLPIKLFLEIFCNFLNSLGRDIVLFVSLVMIIFMVLLYTLSKGVKDFDDEKRE